MNYYLKAFLHYADFTGRARRKEFWYFVLFNILFVIVAMLIDVIAGWDLSPHGSNLPNYGPCYMTLAFAVFLPGLAVAVRRLHDLGKSGWWMLIGLIPLIGAIWLIVLMCLQGKEDQNRYGFNPVQVNSPFTENDRLKSISITFIVAAAGLLIQYLVSMFTRAHFLGYNSLINIISNFLTYAMILLLGIFLYPASDEQKKAGCKRVAIVLLGIYALINFLQGAYPAIVYHQWQIENIIFLINMLLLLAFVVVVLGKAKQATINLVAVSLIILSLLSIIINIVSIFIIISKGGIFETAYFPVYIIQTAGIILLAGYYLPHKAITENEIE